MLVRQVMSPQVRTVHVDTPVGEAFRFMQETGVRHLPVVDGSERLVGLLDDRSVHDVLLEEAGAADLRVRTIMTVGATTVEPDTPLVTAARLLRETSVDALPVVDGDRLVGLVSVEEMVGVFADLLLASQPA